MESSLSARRKSQTELSDLQKWLTEKTVRQTALETSGDLHNPAVLAEIGRLQILTNLLPRRIAAKQEQDAQAEQALTQATNQFIREHLGPRVRQLTARTRTIVEGEMSPHFSDPAALIRAVAGSDQIQRIQSLDRSASLTPPAGAIAHAESAVKSWTATLKLENELKSRS